MTSSNIIGFDKRITISTFAAVYGVGYLSYMLMPLQIGALIESLDLNEAQAGVIATVELLSLAIALIVLAPKISAFDKRKLALYGAMLVVIGHTLSAIVDSYTLLILCRASVGLGAGMAVAAGNAIVAGSNSPQRLFAIILSIGQLQAACFLVTSPEFISRWAHAGIYGFLALWTLLMMVLLNLLPAHSSATADNVKPDNKFNFKIFFIPSVLAMILIGASDSSMWAFQERIANSLGLDNETTGLVLGAALISGMLGAALAAIVGKRLGQIFPIVSGLLWMAACYLIITQTTSQTIYITVELSYLFAYGFVIPYLFGLNGDLDPEGGAMVAANACNLIGNAIGPVCAGFIIVNSGYSTVGFIITFFAIVAMTMYLMVIRKTRLQSQ